MRNWIGGFTTATLLIYGALTTYVGCKFVMENEKLKSQLENKKEEEE